MTKSRRFALITLLSPSCSSRHCSTTFQTLRSAWLTECANSIPAFPALRASMELRRSPGCLFGVETAVLRAWLPSIQRVGGQSSVSTTLSSRATFYKQSVFCYFAQSSQYIPTLSPTHVITLLTLNLYSTTTSCASLFAILYCQHIICMTENVCLTGLISYKITSIKIYLTTLD